MLCHNRILFLNQLVNYDAIAQAAVSIIIMASEVLVTLLFLMPLSTVLLQTDVVLGAIVIATVIRPIDYQAAYKLSKVDKLDFLACLCSFFGVLFISVPLSLRIAPCVTAIDTSGIDALCKLRKMLDLISLRLY